MKVTNEQVENIRRARRMFSEDTSQQDLSIGTCTALIVLQLMELQEVLNRIAERLDREGPFREGTKHEAEA